MVTVGERTWFFSYRTCIAFERLDEAGVGAFEHNWPNRCRRQSNYSPTTAKHMGLMGVKDWPKVDDVTFEQLATS